MIAKPPNSLLFWTILYMALRQQVQKSLTKERSSTQVFREASLCVCLVGKELEDVFESWISFDQRKCIFIL